jgi:hypothetical protein
MPETAIDKNGHSRTREYDIRPPWQSRMVDAKAQATAMKLAPNQSFRASGGAGHLSHLLRYYIAQRHRTRPITHSIVSPRFIVSCLIRLGSESWFR